ncbi:uncharacterized protein LOC119682958 [Teleopsis dalmanni]|uniref:uncharacterized protein LOC119682958 n=1 Tax=Teleopsis dalmanni TaxID=139649 RepID=UPI0018CD129E|nr:uncharacterized protein LOC119682958 [Teleopsis dalmanni]
MESMEYSYNSIKIDFYMIECECMESLSIYQPKRKYCDILKEVATSKYEGYATITFIFRQLCFCNMDKQLEKLYEAINSNEYLKYVSKIIMVCSHIQAPPSPESSAVKNSNSEPNRSKETTSNSNTIDEIITIRNDVMLKVVLSEFFRNSNSRALPPVDNLILLQCQSITTMPVDENNPAVYPFMFFNQIVEHGKDKSIQEIANYLEEDWGVIQYKENSMGYILYSLTTTTGSSYYYNINPALVIIINHMNFEKFTIRSESAYDIERLRNTFISKKIPFIIIKDGSAEEVERLMSKVRRFNFTGLKNLYIVVMSHGDEDDVIYTKTDSYNIKDTVLDAITSNKTLKHTEKCVLVNACRGTYDPRYDDDELEVEETDTSNQDETLTTIYSSQKGTVSYMLKDGARVVKEFCEEFERPFMNLSINEFAETIETNLQRKMSFESKITEYCTKPETPHNVVMEFRNIMENLSTYKELFKIIDDEKNQNKIN